MGERGHPRGRGAVRALWPQSAAVAFASRASAPAFRVFRLDDLFLDGGPWAGERFAFGHFDVEGSELGLLRGAASILARDRPIFTAEVATHRTKYNEELLAFVASKGYQAYVDCRNVLCLPREREAELLRRVPSLHSQALAILNISALDRPVRWQVRQMHKQNTNARLPTSDGE